MDALPSLFLKRLRNILLPQKEYFDSCLQRFSQDKPVSVRINTLKTNRDNVLSALKNHRIAYRPAPSFPDALILTGVTLRELSKNELITNGCLYIQSLSSQLPVLILDPKPGERVLDMCAAPGSKTTQIASRMQNQGEVLALENVKDRYYKLKSVVTRLDARIVRPRFMDARKLRPDQNAFDKILVDAPCSSEGRFQIGKKETYAYWSLRKIKEMVRKQRGLLLKATRLLKSGGVLVFSTCTFAPEENEGVVDWLLKKTSDTMDVVPIAVDGIKTYPAVTEWQGKTFRSEVSRCLRVLPDDIMEGFFIAKFTKKI